MHKNTLIDKVIAQTSLKKLTALIYYLESVCIIHKSLAMLNHIMKDYLQNDFQYILLLNCLDSDTFEQCMTCS